MKFISLIGGLFLISSLTSIYAQVGINTTDPQAILDIRSSDQVTPANTDGILIPKVDDFPIVNPTATQDGMMVYATGNGTPVKGFYYWESTSFNWVPLTATTGSNGWLETGNAGTNPATNFIGTTDAQDLSFRTNDQNKMRLKQKGQLEFLNTGQSVFIGEGAGNNDDLSTNQNTFVGFEAGFNNTTGFLNSFYGRHSGFNNTTGSANSFFGFNSGRANTTGNSNNFFGNAAGSSNTTGSNNSFFGTSAGSNNTTGNSNSFYGQWSGLNNTTGSANSFFGNASGISNTTGILNAFFGNTSGQLNTTGQSNSFFGSSSGGRNTTGNSNAFYGSGAGFNNTTASGNSFFGRNSGFSNTTGSNNSFFGSASGQDNTTGIFNSFYGVQSGADNTIGVQNSFYGFAAGENNTSGSNNIAVGERALFSNLNGSSNVAVGRRAGLGSTGFSKSGGVFIGNQAGELENNDNRLYIDNSNTTLPLIYGEFDTNRLGFNGDVGIGHQAPQAALHVEGFGNANTQNIVSILESNNSNRPVLLFAKAPPTSTNDFSAGMSLEYDGRGADSTNKMLFNGIGGNSLFEFQNGGDFKVLDGDIIIEGTAGDRHLRMDDAAGNNDRVLLRQAGTNHIFAGDIDNNNGNFTIRTGGANAVTVLSGSRNVGIGLTNPTFRLQLSTNSAAKPTSQLWTVVSDSRLKKDVRSFTDGLEILKQIDPVWFTYNGLAEMPNETGVGTIAQDLEVVAPYLVKDWEYKAEDGSKTSYKAVDYGPLTFIMVNAIKEQASVIKKLENQLEEQQISFDEKINSLEERLRRLEN